MTKRPTFLQHAAMTMSIFLAIVTTVFALGPLAKIFYEGVIVIFLKMGRSSAGH